MIDNTPISGGNRFCWSQYDALPSIVRRAIQNAPIKVGSERAWLAVCRGVDPRAVARREHEIGRSGGLLVLREFYGPDHPSLQRSGR